MPAVAMIALVATTVARMSGSGATALQPSEVPATSWGPAGIVIPVSRLPDGAMLPAGSLPKGTMISAESLPTLPVGSLPKGTKISAASLSADMMIPAASVPKDTVVATSSLPVGTSISTTEQEGASAEARHPEAWGRDAGRPLAVVAEMMQGVCGSGDAELPRLRQLHLTPDEMYTDESFCNGKLVSPRVRGGPGLLLHSYSPWDQQARSTALHQLPLHTSGQRSSRAQRVLQGPDARARRQPRGPQLRP